MWCPDWFESAHETLKRKHSKYLAVASVLAVVLTGIGAVLAPPYIPAPYVPPLQIMKGVETQEEIVVEKEPGEVKRPELRVDWEVSPDASPEVTILEAPNFWEDFITPEFRAPEVFTALVDQLPVPLHCESPDYPIIARKAQAEGVVKVEAIIDEDGRVIWVAVYESDAAVPLEKAALEAAWKWLFKPAMQGNVPVKCRVIIPFEFVLD